MAKELSMSKLDQVIGGYAAPKEQAVEFQVGDQTISVLVKHTISLEDMSDLVCSVVGNLFVSEGRDGEVVYKPELYEAALTANILSCFTNLKNLNADRITALLYASDIAEKVVAAISSKQLLDIRFAINQRIEFICKSIHAEQQYRLNEAAMQVGKAAQAFQALTEQFSVVDQDQMKTVLDHISKLTPEVLAGAVAKAREE